MAQQTVVTKYLTDDMDGSDADETIVFGFDKKTYEIDLNKRNAAAFRKVMKPYLAKGRRLRIPRNPGAASNGKATGPANSEAFSKLTPDEKLRFRAWANLPKATRIRDERVKAWITAGKP